MGTAGDLAVGLLGPVVLFRDGAPVTTQSSLLRTAVSVLASEPNAVVSAPRLVEELWGAELPRDPRSSLQVAMTRLRRWLADAGLPDDALQFGHGGYRLAIDPDAVDVHRFESACTQASGVQEPAERLEWSDQGLGLWRSEPFAGCVGSVRLEIESVRLSEIRLQLIETRLDSLCHLGRYPLAVAELTTLAADHPARERFTWLLMLALYRQGRQRDALAAFERTRRRLAEDFGLLPGPELVELEDKILAQVPDLDGGAPPEGEHAVTVASSRPLLLGRDQELEVIRSCLDGTDHGTVLVVTGEAGSGKTTLLNAAAHDVSADGAVVGSGRFDGDQAPFAGWISALGSIGIDLNPSSSFGTGTASQTVANHLAVRAQGRRVLLILEDVHLADVSSLALLVAIARRELPPGLCVAASARQPDLSPRPEWTAAHADIAMTGAATDIRLAELSQPDVLSLAELRLSHFGTDAVRLVADLLWELTAGHPLHLSALMGSMAKVNTVDDCLEVARRVPKPLEPLFQHQLSSLPNRTRDLIEALAVSRSATLQDLAALCEMTPVGAANEMRAGLDVGIVVQRETGFELRHALARTAVLERIAAPARQQLSWSVLQMLEKRGLDPFEALRLSIEAGTLVDAPRLGRIHLQAGRVAHQRGAFHQAADLLAKAREGLQGTAAAEATVFLGMSLAELGRNQEAEDLFDEVIDCEPNLDVHLQVLAAVGEGLGNEAAGSPERFRRTKTVLQRTEGHRTRERCSLLFNLEFYASALGEPMGGRTDELAELALELDDPMLTLRAVHAREYAGSPVPPFERLAVAERAYEHATKTGDPLEQITATQAVLRASLIAGEPDRAHDLLWEHRRLSDRSGRRYPRWFARTTEAGLLDAAGDKEAETKARQALELGTELGIADALGTYAVHLLFSNWLAGTLESVRDLVDQAVTLYPRIAAWRAAAASARAQGGHDAEADEYLRQFLQMREDSAAKIFDLPGLCLAATAAANLTDHDAAAVLLKALPTESLEFVVAGMGPAAIVGPIPLFVSLLENVIGDRENALRHEVAARELCIKVGWSPWISACVFVEENLLSTSRTGEAAGLPGPYPLGLKP